MAAQSLGEPGVTAVAALAGVLEVAWAPMLVPGHRPGGVGRRSKLSDRPTAPPAFGEYKLSHLTLNLSK